jgi:hypothetical protein
MVGACPWGNRNVNLKGLKLKVEEKRWLGEKIVENQKNIKKFILRFRLSRTTLNLYARIVRDPKGVFYEGYGRPGDCDAHFEMEMKREMEDALYLWSPAKTKLEALKVKQQTADIRMKDAKVSNFSDRSYSRFEQRNGIRTGNAEVTTNARVESVASVRNFVSFAAMNQFMVPKVSSKLIFNVDATQFIVGHDACGNVTVKYIETEDNKDKPLKSLPDGHNVSKNLYAIKYFLFISAFGFQTEPVYVIADDSMDEDAIDVHRVEGLGVGTQLESHGYLVFCKTRCCNLAFFVWYNKHVVIPAVGRGRDHFNCLSSESLAWFQLDGEPVQIQCYTDKSVIKTLEDHRIVVGKPPGSSTAATQPCDRGNCFKGPKTTNKKLEDVHVEDNEEMITRLTEVIGEHNIVDSATSKKKMSAAHKRMAVFGLLRVKFALEESMTSRMIKESFALTGIYPYSFEQIMTNCTTPLSIHETTRLLGM